MKWIILIGDQDFSLDTIRRVKHIDSIDCYDVSGIKNRYCVEFNDGHLFYDEVEGLEKEYTRRELALLPYSNPRLIMMTYTDKDRMRMVLRQQNFVKNVYVDNENGLILPIQKFIQLGMPVLS